MATSRRDVLKTSMDPLPSSNDPLRELFEACKVGDIARVRKLVTPTTVNARDTAGRKSTPLHFAAGKFFMRNSYTTTTVSFNKIVSHKRFSFVDGVQLSVGHIGLEKMFKDLS